MLAYRQSLNLIKYSRSLIAVALVVLFGIVCARHTLFQISNMSSIVRLQERHYKEAIDASQSFHIRADYDYNKSTEENYEAQASEQIFVGKFAKLRSELDYTYHSHYTHERQLLHDRIMNAFLDTIIHDGEARCNIPLENWLVFTAGTMGAGKGHTLRWLDKQDIFPLDAFVRVDPDSIRELLPEWNEYFKRDPYSGIYARI